MITREARKDSTQSSTDPSKVVALGRRDSRKIRVHHRENREILCPPSRTC
jgi:hypothetical protein